MKSNFPNLLDLMYVIHFFDIVTAGIKSLQFAPPPVIPAIVYNQAASLVTTTSAPVEYPYYF